MYMYYTACGEETITSQADIVAIKPYIVTHCDCKSHTEMSHTAIILSRLLVISFSNEVQMYRGLVIYMHSKSARETE